MSVPYTFPTYRRSANGQHFYRIASEVRFTEVQLIGGRVLVHEVTANTYPERLRIAEMLAMVEGMWSDIPQGEFEQALGRAV
ncbi:MAG: hypothetical protein JNM31_14580 [Flavobacteriales bacterium]|nr:hypothetical protein [Flavobacteriales bacterium]